jgi:hypothetical protein
MLTPWNTSRIEERKRVEATMLEPQNNDNKKKLPKMYRKNAQNGTTYVKKEIHKVRFKMFATIITVGHNHISWVVGVVIEVVHRLIVTIILNLYHNLMQCIQWFVR